MKNQSRSAQWLYGLSAVSLLGSLLVTPAALAQSAGATDLNTTPQNSDASSNGLDMFDLIHRAQQGPVRSTYEFLQDQQQNISSEAADFRTRQREALQQSPSVSQPPTAPAPDAQSINSQPADEL